MKLSIVIVSFNCWEDLKGCLSSIYAQTKEFEFEIIVVDNGSTDGSPARIPEEFPQVRLIENKSNRGFAAANNQGIAVSCGDYVLLLNPDTVLLDNALQRTLNFAEMERKAGVVGCKLKFPDDRLQYSVRGFPTLWNIFCESTFLYLLVPQRRRSGTYLFSKFDYTCDSPVDWVCGAFFMVRRSLLREIGNLDEQFFMYGEEVEFCYRARKAGWSTWFFAGASVIHRWRSVSNPTRRAIVWSMGADTLFIDKHFDPVRAVLAKSLKCIGIVFRIVAYTTFGFATASNSWITKATYQFSSLLHFNSPCWKYAREANGVSVPWPEV